MINLDERRPKDQPLWVISIQESEIPDVDLTTIHNGDWMYGVGSFNDFAIIGFVNQLGRLGYQIKKREP